MLTNGFVYLLLEVNQYGEEYHKIGISKNEPEKRLKQLQTGNPNEIRVLKIYQSKNYKKIEKLLHSRFSNKKTLANNEWFHLSNEEVISFLEEYYLIYSTRLPDTEIY